MSISPVLGSVPFGGLSDRPPMGPRTLCCFWSSALSDLTAYGFPSTCPFRETLLLASA